jgi:molybdenum cofactor biosynthesis protein B
LRLEKSTHKIAETAMAADDHKRHAPASVRVFMLTISDTRTEENDTSGRLAKSLLTEAGHVVAGSRILKDEPSEVAALVRDIATAHAADVLISSGGTGISHRDTTYEALTAIFEKRLDGFGELFRMLSYAEIGSAAMLSRAVAGIYRGLIIFSLPGSRAAVRLGLEKLILPELGHLAFESRRQ